MIVRVCVWAGTQAAEVLARPDCPARRLARVYGSDRRLREVWESMPGTKIRIEDKGGRTLFYQRGLNS